MTQTSKQEQESCSIPCNLCGSTEVSLLSNRSRSGESLRTVICIRCGLVWSDPFPHNPRNFYENDYRVSYKGAYSPKPKHILRAGNLAMSRYQKLARLFQRPQVVLDVGAGGGEFTYLLQSLGHDAHGIEPNKGYAEYSIHEYGLNIQVGFIQDVTLPQNTFDVITIWHALEHTENPYAVLVKLCTLLKPQGILVIEVPNIEATCQSPKSTFHEAHLFNFNVKSLRKLAEKAGLVEEACSVSADGANITMFVQKVSSQSIEDQSIEESALAITGNAEHIINIVQNHTSAGHYITSSPYVRLYRRTRQVLREKQGIKNFKSGKQLLDQLYSPLLN